MRMIATIKHDNSIYHGVILRWINPNTFIFGFRVNGKNYEWECHRDYWEVIL
jgi:hypothetical protein